MFKTVFIPAAGIGSRMLPLTEFTNKCLLPVAYVPAISRIIDSFPKHFTFIIALGYKSDIVKQYFKLMHKDLKIKFVKINNFSKKGSGLSLTLNKSKKYLDKPFIFCPCDTIFKDKINFNTNNNIIFFNNKISNRYRTLYTDKNNNLKKISLKKNNKKKKYIGLAFIKDYKVFWNTNKLTKKETELGEVERINYMLKSGKKFKVKKINYWLDIGEKNYLKKEINFFKLNKQKLPNILLKNDEFIYFYKNKVIKFSDSKDFIKDRVKRNLILQKYVPIIKANSKNFYIYNQIKGDVLSKRINKKNFINFLNFCKKYWNTKLNFPDYEKKNFKSKCLTFYKNKTIFRIHKLINKNPEISKIEYLGKKKIRKIPEILKKINWKNLSEGQPVNFHGDLHFENVLINKSNKFYLLDYRQSFNKNYFLGDIYYDLAKIMHGIYINHNKIFKNKFKAKIIKKKLFISYSMGSKYRVILKMYENWIIKNKFDLNKVKIITGLIFLNIAPLHHGSYKYLLFGKGVNLLNTNL